MELKIIDGVKNRITQTPSRNRNNKTKTNVNYTYICFFKYLKHLIRFNNNGGDYYE